MKQSAARSPQTGPVNTIAPAPSGAGIDVLVLTEDDFFLLAVRRVVTLPNRVWHATSESQAADLLVSTPCAVALLDYSLVRKELEAVATRLRQQFPDLGFVVAGEPDDEQRVTRHINSDAVQGFVVKAQVTQDLAGAIETGINRHLAARPMPIGLRPVLRSRLPIHSSKRPVRSRPSCRKRARLSRPDVTSIRRTITRRITTVVPSRSMPATPRLATAWCVSPK